MTRRQWLALFVVAAVCVADAASDVVMFRMFGRSEMFEFSSWSGVQWAWHALKWVSFYPSLTWMSLVEFGKRKTMFIAVACYVLWEFVYVGLFGLI